MPKDNLGKQFNESIASVKKARLVIILSLLPMRVLSVNENNMLAKINVIEKTADDIIELLREA